MYATARPRKLASFNRAHPSSLLGFRVRPPHADSRADAFKLRDADFMERSRSYYLRNLVNPTFLFAARRRNRRLFVPRRRRVAEMRTSL